MTKVFRRSTMTAALAVVLAMGCASNPTVPGIQRLVVLGDSNVDTGNLYEITDGKLPAPPNWNGRYGNGPVVVEYLVEMLGAQLESHAVGGATTGTSNIVARLVPEQAHVEHTGVEVQLEALAAAKDRFSAADLIVIWAGSNDIYGASRERPEELSTKVEQAASNLEQAIRRLHTMGATRFVVANRTPREILGSENDLNGVQLNAALALAVERVRRSTKANVLLFDAYTTVARMMKDPQAYGFTETGVLCIRVPACADDTAEKGLQVANNYVNWDSAHKTTRVHKLMAEKIRSLILR